MVQPEAELQQGGALHTALQASQTPPIIKCKKNLKMGGAGCGVFVLLLVVLVATHRRTVAAQSCAPVSFHCDNKVGLVSPLPLCGQSIAPITKCTGAGAEVLEIPGINKISRPFCRISPSTPVGRSLPLVLFFHGAMGSADSVLSQTNLAEAARTWVWPGRADCLPALDAACGPDKGNAVACAQCAGEHQHTLQRAGCSSDDIAAWCSGLPRPPPLPGFVLVVPSGATLSWPREGSKDGSHWDFYHRDLSSSSNNPDVALADAIIDAEVASGHVDPGRIFVMGWSNGGFFAQMYAIARSAGRMTPTPGGNFVAAASVYTAADPFNNLNLDTRPSCQLVPYPRATEAKLMITSNNCDLIACDAEQAAQLEADSRLDMFKQAPGFDVNQWVSNARDGTCHMRWDLVDASDQARLASGCAHGRSCTPATALRAHSKWPAERLGEMLTFLGS